MVSWIENDDNGQRSMVLDVVDGWMGTGWEMTWHKSQQIKLEKGWLERMDDVLRCTM